MTITTPAMGAYEFPTDDRQRLKKVRNLNTEPLQKAIDALTKLQALLLQATGNINHFSGLLIEHQDAYLTMCDHLSNDVMDALVAVANKYVLQEQTIAGGAK